jgi:hypothetical protein
MKWIEHLYLPQGDDGCLYHEMTLYMQMCFTPIFSTPYTYEYIFWTPKEGVILGYEMPFSRTKKQSHVFI